MPSQFFYHSKLLLRAQIHESMGSADEAHREFEGALAEAERYRATNPAALRAHTSLALIYAGLGREKEARETAQRCLDLVPPEENPAVASQTGLRIMAQINARFGAVDLALDAVRTQIEGGYWKRQDLLLDPDWELLRRDGRFLALAQAAVP